MLEHIGAEVSQSPEGRIVVKPIFPGAEDTYRDVDAALAALNASRTSERWRNAVAHIAETAGSLGLIGGIWNAATEQAVHGQWDLTALLVVGASFCAYAYGIHNVGRTQRNLVFLNNAIKRVQSLRRHRNT